MKSRSLSQHGQAKQGQLRRLLLLPLLLAGAHAEPLAVGTEAEPLPVPAAETKTGTPAVSAPVDPIRAGQPQLKTLQQQADQQVKTLAPVVPEPTGKAVVVTAAGEAEAERVLAQAWALFKAQRWGAACQDFARALRMRPKHEDTRFGQALCLDREGRPDEAIYLLEALVQAEYRLPDTLPMLVGLLYAMNRLDTAELYAQRMPELAAQMPVESLREAKLRRDLQLALQAREPERIWALWQEAAESIERCHLVDLSLRAGQLLARPARARSQGIYESILRYCPRLWDARIGALFGLQSLLSQAELTALFEREQASADLPKSYRQQLRKARLDMLRARLGAVAPDSLEAQGLYTAILQLAPEETNASLNLAWWHYRRGDNVEALPRFKDLYERHAGDSAALGLTLTYARMGELDAALEVAHAAALRGLELELLQRRLAGLSATDALAQALAGRLLTLAPDAPEARFIIAWQRYHEANFPAAIGLFSGLLNEFPDRVEYRSGLATAQLAGGLQAEALQTLAGISAEHAGLARAAHLAIADSAYAHGDYALAESEARWVLDSAAQEQAHAGSTAAEQESTEAEAEAARKQQTEHMQAAHRVLAFALFAQGRDAEALTQFNTLNNLRNDPDMVNIVAELQRRQGALKVVPALLAQASGSTNELARLAAAEQYARLDWPMHAARSADGAPANPYRGRDQVELSYGFWQSERSGSANTSAVERHTEQLQVSFALGTAGRCAVSYRQDELNSGRAGASAYVGSVYLRDSGSPRLGLTHEAQLDYGLLHCQLETWPLFQFQVGTMPDGGVVDAGWRWRGQLHWQDWRISAWQEPVQGSVLAYSGSIDPYTGLSFGAVRERAGELRYQRTLDLANWFSARLRVSDFLGENVVDNSSDAIDIAYGHFARYSTKSGTLEYDFGALAYYRSYERNSNFYTYGHGGYYSPQQLYGLGPRMRLQSIAANSAWRLDAAMTGYRSQTDSAAQFPLLGPGDTSVEAEAAKLLDFDGGRSSGLSGQLSYNHIWRLAGGWRLAFDANYARAQDYHEWWAGLELRYHFGAPSALLSDDFIAEDLHLGFKD